MVRLVVGILVAIILAGAIAFHPRTYGRPGSAADLEHPSTLLLYSVIGAVVAQIVAVQPAMAFVVFGIGGLLRFRTNVGAAEDTGQVILVTIVGVACGLHLYPLAALATAAGWLLLYYLRGTQAYAFVIDNIEPDRFTSITAGLRDGLKEDGFRILREEHQPGRGRIKVLMGGPANATLHQLERSIAQHDGAGPIDIDWQS